MSILLQTIDHLQESFCQAHASHRNSPHPPPNHEELLSEYGAFLEQRTQSDTALTERETSAVTDLNLAAVEYQIALAETPTDINVDLIDAALNWNMAHAERISAELIVGTYVLRGTIALAFKKAPLSSVLMDLDEALCIANCAQNVAFETVAEVQRLRSRVLAALGHYMEAEDAELEVLKLLEFADDYKKAIQSLHRLPFTR